MSSTEDFVTIPGFEDSPVASAGRELVAASRRLGEAQAAAILRAWAVPHIFAKREAIFDAGVEPVAPLTEVLRTTAATFDLIAQVGLSDVGSKVGALPSVAPTTESVTGEHYGNLFKGFSPDAYWNEAAQLLRTRLQRNGVDVASLAGQSVVDAGCGGGRYTGAWRQLGARPALGIDISPINVIDARRRADIAGVEDLRYEQGDVLALDLPDSSHDIVFSNGVLHHTRDWQRGVAEIVRVLKPHGIGWLYLIEHPGGLFWTSIEILRGVTQGSDRETARTALDQLGIAANRIFYMLDHVMVPINIRLTSEQIESCLTSHGATNIRRLTRGVDFDRVERLHRGEPFADVKYGVGEHRYLFSKSS